MITVIPEKVAISVLDVLNFHQKPGHFYVPKRKFSAISLRLKTPGKYVCNGKSFSFLPGSICIIPEGVSYERTSYEEDILVIHFHMLDYVMEEIEIFKPNDMEKYVLLFETALDLRQKNESGASHGISSLLYQIFAELTRDFGFSSNPRNNRMIESAEYMRQNLSDPGLSVPKLSQKACVSVALYRREFHRVYGTSPKKYLDALRIQYAKTLLETGYFSQKEIAQRCGFSDVGYFRAAFKAKTGYNVSEYRKVHSI